MRMMLLLAACTTAVACTDTAVAPAVIGTAGGGDAVGSDGQLGDGAVAADGAKTAADGAVAPGGETAVGADGAIQNDTVATVEVTPIADAPAQPDAAPPADTTLPDGFVPPDIATAEVVYTPDAAQPDGATAKYQLCSALLTCVWVSCGGNWDATCANVCLGSAGAAATAAIAPYLTCVNAYCTNGLCAGNPSKTCVAECAGQKCNFPAIACGADGKTGSAECALAFGCLDSCKEKGAECSFACYANLSKPAQTQLDALFSCAIAAGGQDPFGACPSQALTCFASGKSGSGGCAPLFGCIDGCNKLNDSQKVGCMSACWAAATPTAQQQWVAISKCINAPNAACAGTLTACAAPTGNKTCLDTVTCWGNCDKGGQKADCHLGCLTAASVAESNKAADLFICMGTLCKPCNGNKACEDECVKTKCATQFTNCLK